VSAVEDAVVGPVAGTAGSSQRDTDELLGCHTRVLELMSGGAGLDELLGCLTRDLERMIPDSRCSVLLLDDDGRTLRHGSAPSLPPTYLAAIDGLQAGPSAGSCGTAAWSGEAVVAEDIERDPRWAPFRDLARGSGLRSCWSTPILGRTAQTIGTFAVYHPYPHRPDEREERLVARLTYLASVAVEHSRLQRERHARLEAEVARTTAEQHARATSDFFTGVSHEMRTPLQAITGFTELLGTLELSGPRREEALQHISAAAAHLLALVDDVLDLARLDARMLPLVAETVDVGEAVDEVTHLLAPLAGRAGVRLVTVPTDDQVVADRRRLLQVLINLVANGIRHGREGGCVRVEPSRDGGRVHVDVRDDGPGIAADRLDRLFRPFDRLDLDEVRDPGTGLGLVVARGLAEAMGGALELSSAPGLGTTARLTLAAAASGAR
jgi:signal transduction histidine kinase